MDISGILLLKRPNDKWNLPKNDYASLEYFEGEKPTLEQLQQWEGEFLEHKENNEYKLKRKREYPEIGEQLDAIWKYLLSVRVSGEVLDDETNAMLGKIVAVKTKHPK